MDTVMANIAMLALGLLAHFLAKWRELRRSEATLTFMRFAHSDMPQTAFAIVSALAAGLALDFYGELTPVTALMTGYFADSALDKIGSRSKQALK